MLPDKNVVEAELVTPTPLLNPNQETLRQVARARQQEKKLITEFHLLAQSQLRGECVEERIGRQLFNSPEEVSSPGILPSSTVHQLSRLDRRPLKAVSADKSVKIDELAESPAELILFSSAPPPQVNEFDEEEKEAVALSNYPREIE